MDTLRLLLADDDPDDCMFFDEALKELSIPCVVNTAGDGEELMALLTDKEKRLPDILFLDLNMPRKNGIECLSEIKDDERLKMLPVVIYSTSLNSAVVDLLYEKGATLYIRKAGDFANLKQAIFYAIDTVCTGVSKKKDKDNFVVKV